MEMAKRNAEEEIKEIPKEQRYPLEMLKANCMKLFGVTSSTFSGATSRVSNGEYTIAEMSNIIKIWMKKGVK